jgi:hypothetical protein
MFEIDHLDFIGTKDFDDILENLFSSARVERREDIPGVRVYIPRKGDTTTEENKVVHPMPSWRKEVRASEPVTKPVDFPKEPIRKAEPKSILEMLEDGDERLEKLLGKIIDKKLDERNLTPVDSDEDEDDFEEDDEYEEETQKKDPFVFIANRLTFLIQTLQPIVFDTSSIKTKDNSITVAIDVKKTFPRISSYDDLGYITCRINDSSTIQNEIDNFIEDTDIGNIYCFPVRMTNRSGAVVWGIKFVVYSKN